MSRAMLALGLAAMLGACSHAQTRPEPKVQLVEVKVATPVPCPALTSLGPEPAYPDSDEALAAATGIGPLAKLYATGRKMRAQRLAEYAVARAACTF